MKEEKKVLNECFMDKSKIISIYISCIVVYFILNFITKGNNIQIYVIFRIYYVILSLSLFILLKQIRRFKKKYVAKIIWIMFGLIIIISILGFIINIKQQNIFSRYSEYIELSSEFIFLLEIFASYILSEYYFNNKKLKKTPYILVILIFLSIILCYYFEILTFTIKAVLFVIELPLIIVVAINIGKSEIAEDNKLNIVKLYMFLTICISIINIYGLCFSLNQFLITVIEIIHLINFTSMWKIVLINLVREPYEELANSLNNEFKQLDQLNKQITIKNRILQKSINVLKEKEYRYSLIFKYMPHPIIVLNIKNDRILFVNKQFLKFANISKSREIINKKMDKYIKFINSDTENENYNAIFYLGDEKKFIQIKLLSKYSDKGKKIILIKDNTSKVHKDQIRKEVEHKKIEDSIRTQFLSSISHDLKTPINVIYSASQVEKIYLKKGDLEALKKYNVISRKNCVYLIQLTNNLIDNSQIKSNYLTPRLKKNNIVEIIEDNVTTLIEYVKWNNVQLIFDTNTEECYLNIDQEFMKRIISNLISNALKFTSDNGTIYVIIHDYNNSVNVIVKDNGVGMDEKFIDKAFNRYATGENNKPNLQDGSGIGLFVVKELVELQGGTVRIQSKPNVGTTVTMQFKKENNYD